MSGWDAGRSRYGCADGARVAVLRRTAQYGMDWDWKSRTFRTVLRGPQSGVVCHREDGRLQTFVGLSGALWTGR